MRHDELYVADLVDSTRAVREYLDGISREHWDEDRVLRDAVLYRLLLLGEIASALPDALRDRYPDVAWRLSDACLPEPGQPRRETGSRVLCCGRERGGSMKIVEGRVRVAASDKEPEGS